MQSTDWYQMPCEPVDIRASQGPSRSSWCVSAGGEGWVGCEPTQTQNQKLQGNREMSVTLGCQEQAAQPRDPALRGREKTA